MAVRSGCSILLLLAACGGPRTTNCGIVGMAGPSLLLEEFTKPGRTLSEAPADMPGRIVVRVVAGSTYPAIVGKTDTSWVIGIDAPLADSARPGFGVLVVDPTLGVRGVLLYQGLPIPEAPVLGTVNVGNLDVPLHGIRAALAGFEDERCPLFPDSLPR